MALTALLKISELKIVTADGATIAAAIHVRRSFNTAGARLPPMLLILGPSVHSGNSSPNIVLTVKSICAIV